MNRRQLFTSAISTAVLVASFCSFPMLAQAEDAKSFRVGMIGLDTSHSIAFTKLLNDEDAPAELSNCKVTVAYPWGSRDIESSTSRIPAYTEQVKEMGVRVVDSIDELLKEVDVVLLETNDGRPHLEQALQVIKAGKPLFIDKPVAGSLADAVAIYKAAADNNVPEFSSTSLRYSKGAQEVRGGSIGKVHACFSYSPCHLEKTHPDLFWYGIHGVEALFTALGAGCESVVRSSTEDSEIVTGTWTDGRVGTFQGIRNYKGGYGGTVFGEKGTVELGPYQGYGPLVVDIVKFFRSGKTPVAAEETLQIYAFMEAADESKRQGGVPVKIADVMNKATKQAEAKLKN